MNKQFVKVCKGVSGQNEKGKKEGEKEKVFRVISLSHVLIRVLTHLFIPLFILLLRRIVAVMFIHVLLVMQFLVHHSRH